MHSWRIHNLEAVCVRSLWTVRAEYALVFDLVQDPSALSSIALSHCVFSLMALGERRDSIGAWQTLFEIPRCQILRKLAHLTVFNVLRYSPPFGPIVFSILSWPMHWR